MGRERSIVIRAQREAQILSLLRDREAVSIRDLSARLGEVSDVTLRRDILRLAEQGALLRTRGGARRIAAHAEPARLVGDGTTVDDQGAIGSVDAIVLPPIAGRGADMLRRRARQRGIPFLAESSPQEGGIYLGPDNHAAGRDLGRTAGEMLGGEIAAARILVVSLEDLPNTRARADGFLQGFRDTFAGPITTFRVDGKGAFRTALRASLDALEAHGAIDVLFGVNDHSVLAALEASDRVGAGRVSAFSVGGEGGAHFAVLARGDKLRAVAALFPEIVGIRSIDVLARALATGELPDEVPTPHAIVTPASLPDYYRRSGDEWLLGPRGHALASAPARPDARARGRTIGFLPHYPAHDWYRTMARTMRERAHEHGLNLVVAAPGEGIAREIESRRAEIAGAAAARVGRGETVLINAGPVAPHLAAALEDRTEITVVTNALAVMERLTGRPGIKVILTSGEYRPAERCLVGPSLGAIFETLRGDKAFLSVDGISLRFGASASDERMALAAWRFVDASREVYALADHSILGLDANHRIAAIGSIDELVTDSGSLPADRLAFTAAGVRVTLADEEPHRQSGPDASARRGWPT